MGNVTGAGAQGIGKGTAQVRRVWMLCAIHVEVMAISQGSVQVEKEKAKAGRRVKAKVRIVGKKARAKEEQQDGTREEKDRGRSKERGKVRKARVDSMSSVQETGADGVQEIGIGIGMVQGQAADSIPSQSSR